jgi:hypothetical protein
MSESERMGQSLRTDTDLVVWSTPADIRARGEQRGRRQRWVVTTVMVVLLLAVGAVLTDLPLHRGTPQPAHPSDPPAPRVVRTGTIAHTGGLVSIAYGNGSVWLAFGAPTGNASPGELVRLDDRLKVTARWAVPGSPDALAVTESAVWVGGGHGNSATPAVGADQVQQFDLDGHLRHTYPVEHPVAMVAQDDSVWVASGAKQADLVHLHDGVADPPIMLHDVVPSRARSMVACADGLYMVIGYTGSVLQVENGRPVSEWGISTDQDAEIGCGAHGGVLVVYTLPRRQLTGILASLWYGPPDMELASLPIGARSLGFSGTTVWLYRDGDLWTIDADSLRVSTAIRPGSVEVAVSVTHGRSLWVVSPDQATRDGWVVTQIAR